jgi:hypothetical protein
MRFTYRCDDLQLAERIKALRKMTGWSFQQITDAFYKEWLYQLTQHGDIYRDIPTEKQIVRAATAVTEYAPFRNVMADAAWHRLNDKISEKAMNPRV